MLLRFAVGERKGVWGTRLNAWHKTSTQEVADIVLVTR